MRIAKYLILTILFSSFAYGAETIYAWGYGDIMGETFKMIKYMFFVNNFSDLWKLVVGIVMTIGALKMLTPRNDYLALPKLFLISSAVWTLFVTTTVDIYIDDRLDSNNNISITSVPWAIAKPVSLFTTLNFQLNKTYEDATTLSTTGPFGAITYSKAGMLAPLNIFQQTKHHKIIDPTINQNLQNYVIECVIPDIENGSKDYNSIIRSTNLWTYFGNTNPAIILPYKKTDGTQELKTCMEVYNTLNGVLTTYVNGKGLQTIAKSMGSISTTALSSAMGTSSQYLLNVSKTATAQLMQNVTINSFENSFKAYSTINGVPSNSMAYYAAKGETTAQSNMIIAGILGSKYIPVTKGILHVILIGLTPLLALMMTTPLALKATTGYILILFWLSCWQVGEVILNHIILTKASKYITSLGSDYTLEFKGIIDSSVTDYINMASSMYWMIPTIALVIATGFSLGTFASLSGGMTQRAARGEMAATEAGGGNVNQGNISHNNYNANAMSSARMSNIGSSYTQTSLAGQQSNGQYNDFGNSQQIGSSHASLFNQDAMSKLNDTMGNIQGSNFGSGSFNGNPNLTNMGHGMYKVNGNASLTGDNGQTLTLNDGATVTQNDNGSFSVKSGTGSYTGIDSQGGKISMSQMEFINGNLTSFNATDDNGVQVQQSMRGNELTRTLSVGGTTVTDVNGQVTGAKIDGVNYSQDQIRAAQSSATTIQSASDILQASNGQSNKALDSKSYAEIGAHAIETANSNSTTNNNVKEYSKSAIKTTGNSIIKAVNDAITESNSTAKADSSTATGTMKAEAKVNFDSDKSVIGKVGSWVTGLGVSASAGASLAFDNKDTFTVTSQNGKTHSYTITGAEKEEFNKMVGERIASSVSTSDSSSESEKGTISETSQSAQAVMRETASSLIESTSLNTTNSKGSTQSFTLSEKINHAQELSLVQEAYDNKAPGQSYSDVVSDINKSKLGDTTLDRNVNNTNIISTSGIKDKFSNDANEIKPLVQNANANEHEVKANNNINANENEIKPLVQNANANEHEVKANNNINANEHEIKAVTTNILNDKQDPQSKATTSRKFSSDAPVIATVSPKVEKTTTQDGSANFAALKTEFESTTTTNANVDPGNLATIPDNIQNAIDKEGGQPMQSAVTSGVNAIKEFTDKTTLKSGGSDGKQEIQNSMNNWDNSFSSYRKNPNDK